MGDIIIQKPVKLVASIIYKDDGLRDCAEKKLKKLLGPLEVPQKDLSFDKTDYYREELGGSLRRKLVCFKKLLPRRKIAGIKIKTNRIEDLFKVQGKRTINIDPGYVTEAKLVLLTTKDYTHRVYVGKDIFAESTLFFKDGKFNSWAWTYPDYATDELKSYFNEVREIYMQEIKRKHWKVS